ncbi:4-oxalocrotonate tautomerase [Bacillus aquiflavi]|uniref:Tautomerase n=1 Tax=Bacillus aquiflavi TaxID=2672567 RepID=A0A6B3W1D5_9BACI|nr:4-oxalocrotonate tautomerase [Bacillus aquiflavi]MBA4538021.1 4-oxalocrotonate tautomerase [Bacillus aquiflavi]NEY82277.1 4-oxalocrotonate tautomerase [Bacillus aquiflavi]UAC48811.1 4-oxalocrotonate tautomerase [Bacillus aquiflavi]
MPFIQINLLEGRSPEKKEQLIAEVTETVERVIQAPKETIRVMINEMPAAHWGIAGVSVKKLREEGRR